MYDVIIYLVLFDRFNFDFSPQLFVLKALYLVAKQRVICIFATLVSFYQLRVFTLINTRGR